MSLSSKRRLPAIPTVTAAELTFAYALGSNVALGKIPNTSVRGMGVNIRSDDTGGVERFELTDTPFNRAAIAIREQFPSGMLLPIMSRLTALNEIFKDPQAKEYIRPAADGSEGEEVSEALFRVAAVMPLNHKLLFNKPTFFRRAKEEFERDPD
ncbi:hypothetical protein LH128_14022 [Sphingomonas sp. LH128]|uniref:hypothetical protein n=1 Tax=Sphingomonas sp. LH128 TaxID=473781 RepID=UPI00027CC9D0|nr:hypothetical protein [Sphingomonas sp. LH128]EJU12392.1 hypothetical protein LH128_14022 [Sphingomonas sp. LH128]